MPTKGVFVLFVTQSSQIHLFFRRDGYNTNTGIFLEAGFPEPAGGTYEITDGDITHTALREVKEETGLELDEKRLQPWAQFVSSRNNNTVDYFIYFLNKDEEQHLHEREYKPTDEHIGGRAYSLEDIISLVGSKQRFAVNEKIVEQRFIMTLPADIIIHTLCQHIGILKTDAEKSELLQRIYHINSRLPTQFKEEHLHSITDIICDPKGEHKWIGVDKDFEMRFPHRADAHEFAETTYRI